MTPQMGFSRTGRISIKLITLLGCLLAIAVLFLSVGQASANAAPANGPHPLHQRDPVPAQVTPDEDASLSEIAVAANGDRVTLVPAFDPDTTLYTATVEAESAYVTATAAAAGAVIDRTSVGEDTTDLASPGKKVHMSLDVAEGTATVVSLRVRAVDQVTTETYYVILSRPADPSVPDITISANPSEYVAGSGELIFTLSREGDTAEDLLVVLTIAGEREWLLRIGGGTLISVSFPAGESEAELTFLATQFSSSVTQSGNLAATLAPVTGYDTSGTALVRIVSQETTPAITITPDRTEIVPGLSPLVFTLEREGPATESLDVTVNFTQTQEWLSVTSQTVTFEANAAEASLILDSDTNDFSTTVTENDDLIVTVAPVAGYDVSGATAQVRLTYLDGPAVRVSLERAAYAFAEDAGTVNVTVVSRAAPGLPYLPTFLVAVAPHEDTAVSPQDYDFPPVSVEISETDYTLEDGSLVARVDVPITITDDNVHEVDERFLIQLERSLEMPRKAIFVAPDSNDCVNECVDGYWVTITDNDPAVTVSFGQDAYTVIEGDSQAVVVTLSDDPQRTVEIPIVAVGQDGATDDDYSGVSQVVTFNASETSRTIPFVATYDTIDDGGESVKLSFGSMLPPGVTQGSVNETVVSIIQRNLTADMEKPGISVPMCQSNGIFIFWQAAVEFEDDPPPHGWRVERRHRSGGEWVTARFDFLGAEAHALQTYSDEYWDWTDTTRQFGVDYTYRVHALDNGGDLMEERNWSRRAAALCP